MQTSTRRINFIRLNDQIKDRIVILAVELAHRIMNTPGEDLQTFKLQAKAAELLNNPDSFKERLTLSVVALLQEEQLSSGVDDAELWLALEDGFDALAGVSRPPAVD